MPNKQPVHEHPWIEPETAFLAAVSAYGVAQEALEQAREDLADATANALQLHVPISRLAHQAGCSRSFLYRLMSGGNDV